MKKSIFKLLGLALLATSVFVSCNDDPDPVVTPEVIENLENGIMEGTLVDNYTLDATTSYNLTALLS